MILGIGCDIVEIKRIEVALQKDHVKRILTPKEQACCEDMPFLRKAEDVYKRQAFSGCLKHVTMFISQALISSMNSSFSSCGVSISANTTIISSIYVLQYLSLIHILATF